jgi:mannose/fructose/N-acetylgalactosamine-specific phosphotransferase system component IIB
MAVTHVRIDNRLIHGQVTVAWVGALDIRHIVVVNDEVAADALQRMLLPQAARGVPTSVFGIDDAVEFCADPARAHVSTLVVAKSPDDAFALLDAGLDIPVVNVGNVAPRPATKFVMVTRSVAVTEDEARRYRGAARRGVPFTARLMPGDRPTDFIELLARKGL